MTISQGRMLRVFEAIRLLSCRPISHQELADRLDIGLRTAYRYTAIMKELGLQVEEVDRTNFKGVKKQVKYIVSGPCPCCGQNVDKKNTGHGSN